MCVVNVTHNEQVVPSSNIEGIAWDFGDGTADFVRGNVGLHSYTYSGLYSIIADIVLNDGTHITAVTTINVKVQ